MTRNTILSLAAAAATLLALPVGSVSAQESKKERNNSNAPADLIGAYTIVSGEKYGMPEPAERIAGTTCRFAEDAIIVLDKEKKEVYAQTYKIDASSTPWKITMKSKITPSKSTDELTAKGLIEKDGDTVKLIYAVPGGETPTEFKTKEKQLMFVMKNERKSK